MYQKTSLFIYSYIFWKEFLSLWAYFLFLFLCFFKSKRFYLTHNIHNCAVTAFDDTNDSVTKLNREIRMFPVSLIAGMLGFRQRDYLEAREDKADMPSMK